MDKFREVYTKIEEYLLDTNTKISVSNVCSITIELMQMVESFTDLSGEEKKGLVLQVLIDIIKNHIDNDQIEYVVIEVARYVVPNVIDTIIAFDKGNIHINISKQVTKCGKQFLTCFKNK